MQSKPKLVISRAVFPSTLQALHPHFDIQSNQEDVLFSAQELALRAKVADALLVVTSDRVDASLLQHCTRLRMVATGSVGTNHIDLQACRDHDVQVSNTPDVLTQATADMAWSLLMASARRITQAERWLREGQWDRWAFDQFLGQDVGGATLGIVGMGRIGSAIARRARGFDMRVMYTNRSAASNEAQLQATRLPLDDLLACADFVVLVVPYSPQTHHLIGASELAKMKSTAVLVNIARGGIVDDAALAAALRAGTLFSAGLDVFEGEPQVHPELLALSNIVLSPHLGSATRNSREKMALLAAQNLIAWSLKQPLPSQVV
jgi:glyoxylate/hydroxypyruvate/2-ketogluconate reductase